MRHIDPDVLALLALGEHVGDRVDGDHLAECGACRAELENLTHAADVGRSTLEAGEMLEPHPRVWSAITAELGTSVPTQAVAPVVTLRRRRWVAPLLASAAAVVVLGGAGVAWQALQPVPATVLASATLEAFPQWPGAAGSAVVEESADGGRIVDISLEAPLIAEGYREVWLISSDTLELVSLGAVRGETGTFTIPDGLDLSRYDLVDISEEPFDGDPTHSGDSIVRGQLSS